MTDDTSPTPGQPSQPTPPSSAPTPPPAPPTASLPPAGAVPPAPAAPPVGYGQPADPASAPPPSKGKTVAQRLLRIGITIVVVIVVGIAWRSFQTSHATKSAPGKGSCVQAKNPDSTSGNASVEKVDCSDPKAQYVVLDKIVGGTDASCNAVAGTQASYTATKSSGDKKPLYVLCLKSK